MALIESRTEEEVEFNKVQYRTVKKEAKKGVMVAKNNAYERLYQRLKLARARERRIRDFDSIRCIKDENGRVLVEDAKVQERGQGYFCKLFNGEHLNVSQHTEHLSREGQQNSRPGHPITGEEVKEALRKMMSSKAVGSDSIPVEVWKSYGEDRVARLIDFFNIIFNIAKMPQE